MPRTVPVPYICPKCLYSTNRRDHMGRHLFSLKGVCVRSPYGGIAEVMTDTIKDMVMKEYMYFPPAPGAPATVNPTSSTA